MKFNKIEKTDTLQLLPKTEKIVGFRKEYNIYFLKWKFNFIIEDTKAKLDKIMKEDKGENKEESKKEFQYTEEERKQHLVNIMDDAEMAMEYKTASVIDEVVQPLIFTSDNKFENHILNFGGVSMGFPTKMIPYLLDSLEQLYLKNGLKHFKGDFKAFTDNDAEVRKDIVNTEYLDLENIDFDAETKAIKQRSDRMKQILKKAADGDFKKLDDSDKAEIMQQLELANDIAQETTEKLKDENLSKEQKQELAKESNEQLKKHMNEVESILLGRVAANTEDIDLAHIKKILEKYPNDAKTGQMAAKEELMRLPAEKRDAILQQLMAEQAKK